MHRNTKESMKVMNEAKERKIGKGRLICVSFLGSLISLTGAEAWAEVSSFVYFMGFIRLLLGET